MRLSRGSPSRPGAFEPPSLPPSRAILHVSAHAHQTCTPLRGFSRFYPVNKDIALFGVSANAARKRTVAIAASLRLNADSLFE